jgi:small neutral amino acid transporter SnatA (MarC family)
MKVMSIILTLLILVIGALYIGETEITLNPFSIKIVAYRKLIGFILIGIGIGMIQIDAGRKAVNDFKVELLEELEKINEPKTEENDNQ